jgi:hypothetical protein
MLSHGGAPVVDVPREGDKAGDVFAVQDEVAGAITAALKTKHWAAPRVLIGRG